MDNKPQIAAGVSYISSGTGLAIGSWIGENWLGLLSALFILLTYATQVFFALRKDRRERELQEAQLRNERGKADG